MNPGYNWGASFFLEYQFHTRLSILVLPGFNQLNYSLEAEPVRFISSNLEFPIGVVWEPPSMNKTWLNFGLVPSFQLNKQRTELKGSSSSGTATYSVTENYGFDIGVKAGIDFEILHGIRLNLSYYNFFLNHYYDNAIIGRPSHWQVSSQIRFNELNLKKKIPTHAVLESLTKGTLVVLLPIKDIMSKGEFTDSLVWAERVFLNQLLIKTFQNHYTFSKVLFCYDSSLNYLSTGRAVFIDENLQVAAETGLSGFYLITGPMEYFVATNENSKKGLFLFDSKMQLIREPFLGYFKLNMNKSDDELETEIYNAVGKLNRALLENK